MGEGDDVVPSFPVRESRQLQKLNESSYSIFAERSQIFFPKHNKKQMENSEIIVCWRNLSAGLPTNLDKNNSSQQQQ